MKKHKLKNLLLAIVGVTALGVVTAEAADTAAASACRCRGRPSSCRSSPGPASMSASTPATGSATRAGPTPPSASPPATSTSTASMVGGTRGLQSAIRLGGVRRRGATSTGATSRARPPPTARSAARPRTPGSARRAAASATPSTASCPISPAGAAFGDVRAEALGFSGTTKTQFSWVAGRRPRIRLPEQLVGEDRISLHRSGYGAVSGGELRNRDRHHAEAQHRARRPEL